MKHFSYLKVEPRGKGDKGIYQVMSEGIICKLEIVDMAKHPAHETQYKAERVYNEKDGEGTHYFYKIGLVDSVDPYLTEEQMQEVIVECWDWFLSYYLL